MQLKFHLVFQSAEVVRQLEKGIVEEGINGVIGGGIVGGIERRDRRSMIEGWIDRGRNTLNMYNGNSDCQDLLMIIL